MFKDYMVNESSEFSTMENNPMIFTLIIPRFITCNDVKTIKEDKVLKNAVDKVEKFIKTLSNKAVKELKQSNKPYAVMDMFKLSKNYKDTFDKYFAEYKKRHADSNLKLVLMGKEMIKVPKRDDIISLGFVSEEDELIFKRGRNNNIGSKRPCRL